MTFCYFIIKIPFCGIIIRRDREMDIKEQIEKVVDRVKNDDKLMEKFQNNPTEAVESILGVDLPDDAVNGVIEAVKAKLASSKIGDALKGFF